MIKFIRLALIILLFSSCEVRPLVEAESCKLNVNTEIYTGINADINADVEKNLVYNWDEKKYGIIEYTIPEKIDGIFYQIKEKKNVFNKLTFINNERRNMFLDLNADYSGLFINQLQYTKNETDDNNTYYILKYGNETKAEIDFSETFNVKPNAEEIFRSYNPNITNEIRVKGEKRVENGITLYYHNMTVCLLPLTYIYVIQVAVYDDDPTVPMNVDKCEYLALNGVASEGEVMRGQTTDKRCCIESHNVKPMQKMEKANVFAERFVTFGIVNDYNTGWGVSDNLYELGIIFKTIENKEIKGKVNITSQLKEKPKGGVISIILNNSLINKSSEDGSGFDVQINDWGEKEIDIDL